MRPPNLKKDYQYHTSDELRQAQDLILSRLFEASPEITSTDVIRIGLPIGYLLTGVPKLRRTPNSVWRQSDVYHFFSTQRDWYPYAWLSHSRNQKRTNHRRKSRDYSQKVDWGNSHLPLEQKAKRLAPLIAEATNHAYHPRVTSRMIQLLTNTSHSSARRIRAKMVRLGLVQQQSTFYFLSQ